MAEMNVTMLLTLVDRASAPVRGFMSLLETLSGVVTNVNTKIIELQSAIRTTGTVTGAAATATNRYTASLESVRQQSSAASAASTALTGHIQSLGNAVTAAAQHVNTLVAGLGGVAGAVAALNAATAAQNPLASGLQQANQHAGGLMQTLKGIAQIWAALEIKKGIVESAKEAVSYEVTQTRLSNMNLPASERAMMIGAAEETSRAIPQFNTNQMLSMAIDLRNATGSATEAVHMLTPFAKAAFNFKMATPEGKTFNDNDMLLIAKALEQRNATLDPARMQAELDMFQKIYATTQGRVDANQILGNLQYAKGGLGQTMELGFMPIFASMIEQIKSQGGQGGAIGTWLTTLQNAVLRGSGDTSAQKERARIGLLDGDKLVWNSQGNINRQKSDLTMAGAELFQRNPYEWVQNILKPALIRAGIDITNDAAVNMTLNKLFPDRNAQNIASMMITRAPMIEKDAAMINQAAAGDEQYRNNIKTARANLDAFKAQMENLGIVMGTTLLPAIKLVAEWFTKVFQSVADFFTAYPAAATFATYALAIASVVLALSGFAAMFGFVLTPVTTLFTALGGFSIIGTVFSTLTAAASGFFGPFIQALIRAAGLVGIFITAFNFGTWLAGFKIAGQEISLWATDLIEWVVEKFQNGWARIGRIIASIIPGAQAAGGVGAAGPPGITQAGRAQFTGNTSGSWGSAGSTSGSWEELPTASYSNEGKPRNIATRAIAGLFNPSTAPEGSNKKKGRFAHYDEELDAARNAYRLAEDADKRFAEAQSKQFKANKLSISEYYDEKLAMLRASVANEILILEREKSAFERIGDKAGGNRIASDITIKRRGLASGEVDIEFDRKLALEKLDKEAAVVKTQLMMTEGQRHAAELSHLQLEMKTKLDMLVLNGRITQSEADQMMARSQAAIAYKQQEVELARIQQDYADKVSSVDVAERNGTMTETAAQMRKLELRKQEAAQLDEIIAKLRVLAIAAGDEKALLQLDKLGTKTQAARMELDPDTTEVLKTAQTGFRTFFNNVLNGTMSVKNAFKSLGQSIFESINSIIAKKLGDALFESLFGNMMGGSTGAWGGPGSHGTPLGSGGGLFGNLSGMFGNFGSSLWSGFQNMLGFGGEAAIGNMGASFIIPGFDTGTDYVPQDMLALVHEGEKITPKVFNSAANGLNNQGPVVQNFNFASPTDMRTQLQVGAQAQRGLVSARRNL